MPYSFETLARTLDAVPPQATHDFSDVSTIATTSGLAADLVGDALTYLAHEGLVTRWLVDNESLWQRTERGDRAADTPGDEQHSTAPPGALSQ